MNKLKQEIHETTKIQEIGNSKTTTIPQVFVQLLDLKKSDKLHWTLDITTGELKITTNKK